VPVPLCLTEAIGRVSRPDGEGRLGIDALKLPHHGSRRNIDNGLLEAIRCRRYLISTSGRGSSHHPDHEALARVIMHGGDSPELVFNYDNPATADWRRGLSRAPSYATAYPQNGRSVVSWEVSFAEDRRSSLTPQIHSDTASQ
jgi:hypothetical protein